MINNLLEVPFFYNLRFLIAGSQQLTRKFAYDNYRNYDCETILDIGCGTGDFTTLFSPKVYLGIDINPKYISFSSKKYSRYQFICVNLLNFKPKNTFDASLLISTLHHFSDGEVRKIFPKIADVTKKVIIIVNLNPKTILIKRLLIKMDRGKFVRTDRKKISLLSQFGKIVKISNFSTGLASQTGIVLIPKKK